MRIYLLLPVILTVLLGCASVDDFRAMSSSERAQFMCQRSDRISSIKNELRDLEIELSVSHAALARGYRIHRSCNEVEVPNSAPISCMRMGMMVNCNPVGGNSKETRCSEVPVSINVDHEKDKVRSLENTIESLRNRLSNEWRECTNYISRLSPEEAHRLYSRFSGRPLLGAPPGIIWME